MRSFVKRLYEFPRSFDRQIDVAQREVDTRKTIAVLKRDSHETANASPHADELLTRLNRWFQESKAR